MESESIVEVKFPEDCWRPGVFADYRRIFGPTTEAPDSYHFAACMQVLGCAIARRMFVYQAGKLYPNFFTCIVGATGIARKDTSMRSAEDILDMLYTEQPADSPTFKCLSGIRSTEGLVDELAGSGKVRLVRISELMGLLAKAGQQNTSNLIPELTSFYDLKRINAKTHSGVAVSPVIDPFLSLMAATTPTWLKRSTSIDHFWGGWTNRWIYYLGTPKPPMPYPPRPNQVEINRLVAQINEVRKWAEGVGEMKLSLKAQEFFGDYYMREYYPQCCEANVLGALVERVQHHIFKLALLYAAADRSHEITEDHMKLAIDFGLYAIRTMDELFGNFADSKSQEIERKILNFLAKEGKPVEFRVCCQNLNMSSGELDKAVQPMIRNSIITNHFVGPKRKRVLETLS